MNDLFVPLTQLVSNVILPNLKSVQLSQTEQIATSAKLERTIEELRLQLESRFTQLTAQLTACQEELAAMEAAFQAIQTRYGVPMHNSSLMIH